MSNVQLKFGGVGWKEGLPNTGTFLSSRMHRNIFTKINGQFYEGWGHDMVHLGYQIHKYGFQIHRLNFKWNHMTMFSEPWNDKANRFKSYVIHYAGVGIFDHGVPNRLEQIRRDIEHIKELAYGYTFDSE